MAANRKRKKSATAHQHLGDRTGRKRVIRPLHVAVFFAAAGIAAFVANNYSSKPDATPTVVPPVAGMAAVGKRLYDANCAACHGKNGGGSEQGPPLIHK